MSFFETTATYAWATFTYLVAYGFVIALAPAASILFQSSWPRIVERLRRLPARLGLLWGIASPPTARGVRSAIANSSRGGARSVVAAVTGTHFLTAYPLFLLGPLLGKDVVLSHVVGSVVLATTTSALWRPVRTPRPVDESPVLASPVWRLALRELFEVGPHVLLGLFAGGLVAAWGVSPFRIELAAALGGGYPAQIGSAIAGTILGAASCLPPVASLFVATYLWKTGIAHAGLVSFLLASAATPLRRRLYRRELGERDGARLWWILLATGPVAGIATALLFRLVGLGIHYRLTPEQLW